ncbi:gustatory receptor for sugar taste 64f-like [Planococcus citri]|uniref:gustatory receptor for sugar taste 64f-like n=1 Tax=Planococcus citri TaxID=170843 RepID=UPI0031F9D836
MEIPPDHNPVIPLYLLDKNEHKHFRTQHYDANRKRPKLSSNSLQKALRPVLLLARCFAVFPVLGIQADDAKGLHFDWFSKPMLLSLLFLTYSISIDVLSILRIIQTGLTYYNTVDFVFLASLTCIYIIFIQLASKWPKFALEWEKVEKHMNTFAFSKNLEQKFKLLTFTIMVLALIEHLSSVATKVVDALPCATNDTDIVKAYFVNTHKHIFAFISYSPFIAFGVALITLLMSCAWNFMDVFIIIMSAAMTERFKQFNLLLHSVHGKIMPVTFWRTMRETYNQLSCVTKLLDELLSPIVLLSFANNLYFICLQLLNSLKPMASTWHASYFVYSFTYLVLRTIVVSLFAASIYDQSKQPKTLLFCVPSESYCTEVARLLNQITSDDLALTGCRFFSVTRTLVLTVAGTIVTYEIVLVQFNAVSSDTRRNTTITCL